MGNKKNRRRDIEITKKAGYTMERTKKHIIVKDTQMENELLENTLNYIEEGKYYTEGGSCVSLKLTVEECEKALCFLPMEVYDFFETYPNKKATGTNCYIHVENKDTFDAAKELSSKKPQCRVAVLNFANPITPGGGVRKGAKAQEESLCLRSSLLKSLESPDAARYYEYNRSLKSFSGSDSIILSKDVEVIRDHNYKLLEDSFLVSAVTCAAPVVSSISHKIEGITQKQMEELLYRRIAGIITCLIHHGYRNIVLGAWGCGAFGNDAAVIAKLFKKVFMDIDADSYFDEICFAVLVGHDRYNYEAFKSCFEKE